MLFVSVQATVSSSITKLELKDKIFGFTVIYISLPISVSFLQFFSLSLSLSLFFYVYVSPYILNYVPLFMY